MVGGELVVGRAGMIARTARFANRELTADDAPFMLALLNDPAFMKGV